ncbi:hypothetical protein K2X33_01210 [bacterium]|nr:hypothetical protein [bacterium]
MFRVVLTFLFFAVGAQAGVFPSLYRANVCAMLAVSIGNDASTVPSVLQEQTAATAAFLRDFRRAVLKRETGLQPHALPIRSHSGAWRWRATAIANRIRGIEIDEFLPHRREKKDDGSTPPVTRAGALIEGRQNIENTLAAMEAIRKRALQSVPQIDAKLTGYQQHLILAAAELWAITLPFVTSDSGAWTIAVPGIIAAFHQGLGVYRHNDLRFFRQQSRIQRFLEAPKNPEWFFDSDTYPVEKTLWEDLRRIDLNALAQGDAAMEQQLASGIESFSNLAWVESLPALAAIMQGMPETRSWVSWDRLVTVNPESGEPVMALFLRYSDERPAYAPVTEASPSLEHSPALVPALAPH